MNIDSDVAMKIYEKHSVMPEEIKKVLIEDKAIFKKVGSKQYIAVGIWNRYLTMFFSYEDKSKEASITTAYHSSMRQIRSYRRMVK